MSGKIAISAWIVLGLSAFALGADQPAFLPQDWKDQTRFDFWFMNQGSRIMPMDWFMRLENADNTGKFVSGLERYGFIADSFTVSHSNPSNDPNNRLPIGFAKDTDSNGQAWIGLTCAACHTNKITSGSRSWLIEGGPSMLNFDLFLSDMVAAIDQAASDPQKNKRFWNGTPTQLQSVQFKKTQDRLDLRKKLNTPPTPAGFGRVDAFGHIFNQVMSVGLDQKTGLPPPSAPASYPFLWDIAQHDFVQWNGSAPNLGVGSTAVGSLTRNIGEVLGVFGEFTVTEKLTLLGLPSYESSVNVPALKAIEDWISQLRSPQWPSELGTIDAADRGRGEIVYAQHCSTCHQIVDRNKPVPAITARMTPLSEVGTDSTEINSFFRTADPGILRGRFYPFDPSQIVFEDQSNVRDLTAYVAMGVYVNHEKPTLVDVTTTLVRAVRAGQPQLNAYKARPLDGVWATAPYLHNGSVASLAQILTVPERRLDHFCVGDGVFDPVNVGYQTSVTAGPDGKVTNINCPAGTMEVDTTQPGNSRLGHSWGTDLSEEQKRQLIAYLKWL